MITFVEHFRTNLKCLKNYGNVKSVIFMVYTTHIFWRFS